MKHILNSPYSIVFIFILSCMIEVVVVVVVVFRLQND
jgi:hypothetical protein